MSERSEKVAAMLAAEVPARDMAFEIAVLARIEQRRFRRSMTRNLLAAFGVALLLAFVMPMLDLDFSGWGSTLSELSDNTLVVLALLIAAGAAWHFRPVAEA
jgi:hypothetical protein